MIHQGCAYKLKHSTNWEGLGVNQKLEKNSDEYKRLQHRIINVDEFNNTNLNISKIGIQNYKYLGYIPAPYSIYEKTYKILPSQIVNIKNGRIVDKLIYWNHSNNSNNIKTQFNLDSIESAIEASVKKMMVADVDVGCFLSGGIDSSLIAAMMQKNSPKKINTFTVGFYEQNYDESTYAKKISNYLNTNHFEIKVSINDMILNIKKIIENFDEPFADSSAIPTELISSLASQKTKVILSAFFSRNSFRIK